MERTAVMERTTKETKIRLSLCLDGTGKGDIHTGIGFFDHMLEGFARHGLFDLSLSVEGDLQVDTHHTIEDTGIVLGKAIKEAVGDKKGMVRYGSMILPMDEALILCALGSVRTAISGIRFEAGSGVCRRFGDRNDSGILLCGFLWSRDESPFKTAERQQQSSYYRGSF